MATEKVPISTHCYYETRFSLCCFRGVPTVAPTVIMYPPVGPNVILFRDGRLGEVIKMMIETRYTNVTRTDLEYDCKNQGIAQKSPEGTCKHRSG